MEFATKEEMHEFTDAAEKMVAIWLHMHPFHSKVLTLRVQRTATFITIFAEKSSNDWFEWWIFEISPYFCGNCCYGLRFQLTVKIFAWTFEQNKTSRWQLRLKTRKQGKQLWVNHPTFFCILHSRHFFTCIWKPIRKYVRNTRKN